MRGQPELLAELDDVIAARLEEATGVKVQDHDNLEKVAGGNELFQQIMGKNREAAHLEITNRGKARATSVLGKATELNEDTFKTVLKKAVSASEIKLNEDKLEALAEKVAHDVLTASIAKDLVDKNPNNACLTGGEKDLVASLLKESPQMKAVHDAASPEAMEPLLATVKDIVQEQSASRAMQNACKQELFAAGMQTFCKMTGLAPGSFTMNTWPLEDKFNITASDLDGKVATAERPYARAGREAIMEAWQPRAERFFTERAQAYTSIASLNVPDALKKDWQQRCLTSKESITADTYTKAMDVAEKVLSTDTLKELLNTETSLDGKVKILEDFGASLSKAMLEIFGLERVSKMGPDERSVLTGLAYEIIFANSTEVLEGLRGQPELLKELDDLDEVIQDKVMQAMDRVENQTDSEFVRIIGGSELFVQLWNEVKSHQEYAL